ncbi:uncharacterized protein LOC129926009 [Biomphalaria glabrata]|uniref:Uncharacterized protein LOC129926009 n=1 Tax=Biomphalaria glabrata TaxID=6526 RepID=A0A9W3A8Y0_BIOGL|nr:uncharacterized protein LOC129926009 [Biomphalaria glabrata]
MSGLTTWSGNDPLQKVGNTDHWTKMKLRAEKTTLGQDYKNTSVPDELLTNRPVRYSSTGPRKHLLENSFHAKAKEGVRYWEIYRPKPTKYGRYAMGAYKTFLGLGSAPRT